MLVKKILITENASIFVNPRVTNFTVGTSVNLNKRVNPGTNMDNVITVGTGIDQGLWDPAVTGSEDAADTAGNDILYSWQGNPLIGKVEVKDITIGATANQTAGESMSPTLAVYETEPGISNLDLFWETGTGGYITELNTNILSNDNTIPMSFQTVNFSLNENMVSGTSITSSFAALAPDGVTVLTAATMSIYNVIDNYGTSRSSEFTLVSDGSGAYHLETNGTFWWSADPNLRVFAITIQVTNGSVSNNLGFAGFMSNTAPILTNPAGATQAVGIGTSAGTTYSIKANNGSVDTLDQGRELTWSITSQATNPGGAAVKYWSLQPLGNGFCDLKNLSVSAGVYDVAVEVTGAQGLTDSVVFTVTVT